ncbi:MAG: hypothetical protein QM770_00895 [Tepidisphaeraceae bacterium]
MNRRTKFSSVTLLALLLATANVLAVDDGVRTTRRLVDASPPAATRPATAPTTVPADLEPKVRALLKTLVEAPPADRDSAEQQLAGLGTGALPLLRSAREGQLEGVPALSTDARTRVDAAIAAILDTDESGPSRITMDVNEAPLVDVIKEINRQARCNLQPPPAEYSNVKKNVTVKLDGASFFEALEVVQKAANLTFQPQPDGWRAFPGQMDFGNGGKPYDSGAFRFFAQSATYSRSVGYGRNVGGNDSFYFNFQGMAEPKIRTTEGQLQVFVDEAKDDKGNDLATRGTSNAYNQGTGQFNGNLQLRYPKDPGKRITVLKGHIKVAIVKSWETIEVADVLGGRAVRNFDGISFTFEHAHRHRRPRADDLGPHQHAVEREHVAGQSVHPAGHAAREGLRRQRQDARLQRLGQQRRQPDHALHDALLEQPGRRTEAPVQAGDGSAKDTKDMEVPFEFKDLAMP